MWGNQRGGWCERNNTFEHIFLIKEMRENRPKEPRTPLFSCRPSAQNCSNTISHEYLLLFIYSQHVQWLESSSPWHRADSELFPFSSNFMRFLFGWCCRLIECQVAIFVCAWFLLLVLVYFEYCFFLHIFCNQCKMSVKVFMCFCVAFMSPIITVSFYVTHSPLQSISARGYVK